MTGVGPIDRAVFYWIFGWPEWLNPLFQLMSEGNKWWPVRIGLAALAGWLISQKPTRVPTILALIAWPLSNVVTDILKNGFQMLRPCVELPDIHPRVEILTSFGTASAHSANMAAVATGMFLGLGWKAWPWMVLAVLVGISRIYVGVHYPSQVLLGWFVGVVVGFIVFHTGMALVRLRSAKPRDLDQAEAPVEES